MTESNNTLTKKKNLRILVECGIMVAAAFVLNMFPIYQMPYGGKVTLFSMAPIMVIALRYGTKWGLSCGFVFSCIKLLMGISDIAYVPGVGMIFCALLDYTLAFSAIGLAGIFRNVKFVKDEGKNKVVTTVSGVTFAMVMRFVCHLVSGALLWYELTKGWYADDPTHIVNKYGMWVYSFLYNGTYMLPELILSIIAVPVILKLLKELDRNFSR